MMPTSGAGATGPLIKDSYPLIPPFAYALVQTDPNTRETKYQVIEVPLTTQEEEILKMIKDILTVMWLIRGIFCHYWLIVGLFGSCKVFNSEKR